MTSMVSIIGRIWRKEVRMGYSVALKLGEEEVYWCDWRSSVSQLVDKPFLGHFRELDGILAHKAGIEVLWGLNNLVGEESSYLGEEWEFLTLAEYLFNLWKACKEYPEATLHLYY